MNFEKLTAYLDQLHTRSIPGCDLIVYKDHEVIYRHQAGHLDLEGTQPVQGDEVYRLHSCSKVFTCCCALQLIEAGKLELDAPVSQYIPAFAHMMVRDGDTVRPAQKVMTVRHLMSMQGGLDYNMDTPEINRLLQETKGQATTRQLADALSYKTLDFEPGEYFQYSFCHDLLGAVIEVASGEKLSDYMKAHLFAPLGADQIGFRMSPSMRAKLAPHFHLEEGKLVADPVADLRDSVAFESGGGGLISNLHSYSLLLDAISCGGVTRDGKQILSPEMIDLWRTPQLCPLGEKVFSYWNRIGYTYGLGVRVRVDNSVGGLGPVGEFGWDGAAGAWAMMDPDHHIAAFYVQHVCGMGYVYTEIHPHIRALIYEGLGYEEI